MKKKRRVILLLVSPLLALLLAAATITVAGLVESDQPKDFALVFGNKVERNGSPSPRLAARLDRAAHLYSQGLFGKVIVSGATGAEGHDEAVVMKAYLVEAGVPAANILVDSEGWDSWQSAVNARRIAEQLGEPEASVIAISQYFHLARCRVALRKAGFEDVSSSYARHVEVRDLYSIAREIPGYAKYLLIRR